MDRSMSCPWLDSLLPPRDEHEGVVFLRTAMSLEVRSAGHAAAGQPAGAERGLEVKAADRTVDVEHLAGEE